ncbi:MAG: DUF882 domain-containing protein [Deltaproteobacteria bacterium]|nr:DUF882 domain-containing protein [Deltaproteobacteria bacterium]
MAELTLHIAHRTAPVGLVCALVALVPCATAAQSAVRPLQPPSAPREPLLAFAPPRGLPSPLRPVAPSKKDTASTAQIPVKLPDAPTIAAVHLHECIVLDPAAMSGDDPAAPRAIDWLLRDRTNWQWQRINDQTLATVVTTASHFAAQRIEVISGYRSSRMNELLRKKGRHVAQHSQHPLATAVDFRLVGQPMAPVFRLLESTHDGGVGRYRDEAFVHVDMGTRRRWRGE